ncbi:Ubiquinol-cytochrome c reductase cytochrome b subunit [Streptomyces sp. MBT84]|nr:Ubiquinol-cytochrome c reductase cytochrome b subunit [Streptomyces sp. MBT84]
MITKRVCLGLQYRDREKLLHGSETGVVRRLPHGEYVELHKPLDAAQRHVLTSHEQYLPLAPGPQEDTRARSRLQRARVRLSRGFYGPSAQVVEPTDEEMRRSIER